MYKEVVEYLGILYHYVHSVHRAVQCTDPVCTPEYSLLYKYRCLGDQDWAEQVEHDLLADPDPLEILDH